MVNLEHKLTVDDLIVEYMICKIQKGCEPSFLTSEFIGFLYFFESKMEVHDTLHENYELFVRFFERKALSDWAIIKDWRNGEKEVKPHMDMIYSEEYNEYFIKANYKLSGYDKSVINTYFMDNGMGQYNKGKVLEIRKIINEYLINEPKRKIDETVQVEESDLLIGKYIAAGIIKNIWDSYIKNHIENYRWPRQCKDINKYLFEIDLADIINLKSIKNQLFEMYSVFSKRIAILYSQDKNLKISSYSNIYLARSNYELLIQGYEEVMNIAFGRDKKSLEIDLSSLTFKESHEMDGVYDWYDDPDIKTTVTSVVNEDVKKLVRILDINS